MTPVLSKIGRCGTLALPLTAGAFLSASCHVTTTRDHRTGTARPQAHNEQTVDPSYQIRLTGLREIHPQRIYEFSVEIVNATPSTRLCYSRRTFRARIGDASYWGQSDAGGIGSVEPGATVAETFRITLAPEAEKHSITPEDLIGILVSHCWEDVPPRPWFSASCSPAVPVSPITPRP